MPYGIYSNIECEYGDHPQFTAQEHQQQVLDYFITKSQYKGLCLFHRLGSGKSCSSIITSDQILKLKENKMKTPQNLPHGLLSLQDVEKIYILTPGSLRQNFIEEYCNRCGFSPQLLKEKYTFMTTNYGIKEDLDFSNSLVIIDEVHNLINGVKNRSKTPTKYYKALMNSKCRIITLTGTPIFNYIWEWPLLGNLLKPGTFSNILKPNQLDEGAFMKNFKIDSNGKVVPKRPRMFKTKIMGIISYFPGKEGTFYPRVIYEDPIKIPMIENQNDNFHEVDYLENATRRKGAPKKSLLAKDPAKYFKEMEQFIMASKYIVSRSVSNFFYPPQFKSTLIPQNRDIVTKKAKVTLYEYKNPIQDNVITSYSTKNIFNQLYTQNLKQQLKIKGTDEKKLISISAEIKSRTQQDIKKNTSKKEIMELVGWINPNTFGNRQLNRYSRKFLAIILNILNNWKGKHVIFSFFKTKSGVNMLSSLFQMCGINTFIYSGDIGDSMRKKILEQFNSEKNRYGEIAKILLVTEAGAEGINILEARHMHIVESSPREMKIQQVIGRVVRYKSHMVDGRKPMPPEEQQVQIWRYWSVSPSDQPIEITIQKGKKKITKDSICVDEALYNKGLYYRKAMTSFLNLLKKSSVTAFKEKKGPSPSMKSYKDVPINQQLLKACKLADEKLKDFAEIGVNIGEEEIKQEIEEISRNNSPRINIRKQLIEMNDEKAEIKLGSNYKPKKPKKTDQPSDKKLVRTIRSILKRMNKKEIDAITKKKLRALVEEKLKQPAKSLKFKDDFIEKTAMEFLKKYTNR